MTASNGQAIPVGALGRLAVEAMIWEWMARTGAKTLTVEFNGEGDSGSFEDHVEVRFHDLHGGEEWVSPTPEQERAIQDFERTLIPSLLDAQGEPCSLGAVVQRLSERIEADTDHGVDWWNNDGGRGEITWILDGQGPDGEHYRRGICLTVEQRVIEYEATHIAITGDEEGDEEGEGSEPNEEAAAS